MKKFVSLRLKSAGFTLIELLVVVLIIGILAAIALPQYEKSVKKARAARMRSIMNDYRRSLQRYYQLNRTFPIGFDRLDIQLPCTPDGLVCNGSDFTFVIQDVTGSGLGNDAPNLWAFINSMANRPNALCCGLTDHFTIRYYPTGTGNTEVPLTGGGFVCISWNRDCEIAGFTKPFPGMEGVWHLEP